MWEFSAKGVEEVHWSVDSEKTNVDDMAQDAIYEANEHLLQFVKGDRVLALGQSRRANKNKDCLDTSRSGTFDVNDIKEMD